MSAACDAACAAWQALLADDAPWGATDVDALLAALAARDDAFEAASRATVQLPAQALAPGERERLAGLLARVAAATLSLEQRVRDRRAAIAAALQAPTDAVATAARSPYRPAAAAARVDVRR